MIEKIVNKVRTTNSSFIFAGAKGLGKRHAAIEVAKNVLCKEISACNVCDECSRINRDIHPNVITIKPEEEDKEIKIDNIRELIKSLTFSAAEINKRFIIIDEAHRMNKSSANALLKTLEEPPRDTIFILLSSNLHSMLPTIISRCEVIKFPPMSNEKMVEILKISDTHPFVPYAMGSVSTLSFYIASEVQIRALIRFLEKPINSYQNINELVSEVLSAVSTDNKAQEIENIEYIISLILFGLLQKYEKAVHENNNAGNILNCIEEVKDMSKKIYMNTSASIVLENMLLEVARLDS